MVKLLLMRGITIPVPHKHTCGCAECMLEVERDALRRSQVRFNQMRLNEMICSTCGQAAQSRKGCIKAFTGKIYQMQLQVSSDKIGLDRKKLFERKIRGNREKSMVYRM